MTLRCQLLLTRASLACFMSSYVRILSTVCIICITSRSTLSFEVWPLTQSSYRSSQWTLSWRHELPSPVHWNPCSSRTSTVTWSPTWATLALLEPLYCRNLRISSTANPVWLPWWCSLLLLCSLLPLKECILNPFGYLICFSLDSFLALLYFFLEL